MPELPDVEVFRRYFDATSLDQEIQYIDVLDQRILAGTTGHKLNRVLGGQRFETTARHGKYMFAGTDGEQWLVLHFGMTGYLRYLEGPAEPPAHTRVLFRFTNEHRLAFVCMRMLGKVELTSDPGEFIDERGLGADALRVDFDEFLSFTNRRGTVKAALTTQSAIAGIGNIYADEILFQARIHPKRQVRDLSTEEFGSLYDSMHSVIRQAIDAEADVDRMPEGFLLPHREEGASCPRCSAPIQTAKVSGRTAYYCPTCQPEP
jgi:formamidopyrimidine-DNA glycosylase